MGARWLNNINTHIVQYSSVMSRAAHGEGGGATGVRPTLLGAPNEGQLATLSKRLKYSNRAVSIIQQSEKFSVVWRYILYCWNCSHIRESISKNFPAKGSVQVFSGYCDKLLKLLSHSVLGKVYNFLKFSAIRVNLVDNKWYIVKMSLKFNLRGSKFQNFPAIRTQWYKSWLQTAEITRTFNLRGSKSPCVQAPNLIYQQYSQDKSSTLRLPGYVRYNTKAPHLWFAPGPTNSLGGPSDEFCNYIYNDSKNVTHA